MQKLTAKHQSIHIDIKIITTFLTRTSNFASQHPILTLLIQKKTRNQKIKKKNTTGKAIYCLENPIKHI